ncbi:MAG: hypothetical protein ABIA08_00225 [bacterium]
MHVTVSYLKQEEMIGAKRMKEAILAALEIVPGLRINREWDLFNFTSNQNGQTQEIRVLVILDTRLSTDEIRPDIKELASKEIQRGLVSILTQREMSDIHVIVRTPDSSLDGQTCP